MLMIRALLHKKIVGIKAKSKSKIRIKPIECVAIGLNLN